MADEERKQEDKEVSEEGSVTLLADDVTAMSDYAGRLAQVMEVCYQKAWGIFGKECPREFIQAALAIFNRATAREPMDQYLQKLADLLGKKDAPGGPPMISPMALIPTRNPIDRLANLLIDTLEEEGGDLLLLGKGKKSS